MVRGCGPLVGMLLGLSACGDAPGGPPDAGGDAPPGTAGLVFAWSAQPALPGAASEDIAVSAASFQLRDVRALGDAAPGDGRTSRASVDVTWLDGDGPAPLRFDQAPPGLYSRLELRLGGDSPYWMRGEVEQELEGGDDEEGEEVWVPWEIRDDGDITVTVPLDVAVAVGGVQEVTIGVDVGDLARRIDWERVPLRGGVRVVDAADPQMPALRERIADSVFRMR
jgi:hypothetical protein